MKLIIDRQRWLRGEGSNDSCLLRESDKKMCCLGFYCTAKGKSQEDILDLVTPGDFSNPHEEFPELITDEERANTICSALIRSNDDLYLEEKHRESKIQEEFKKLEVDVEFIN